MDSRVSDVEQSAMIEIPKYTTKNDETFLKLRGQELRAKEVTPLSTTQKQPFTNH